MLLSLAGGVVAFFVSSLIMFETDPSKVGSISNFGRIWLIAGSQASAATPFGDSYLTYFPKLIGDSSSSITAVFTKGADFSAYQRNTIALIFSRVLCFVFEAFFNAETVVLAVEKFIVSTGDPAVQDHLDTYLYALAHPSLCACMLMPRSL